MGIRDGAGARAALGRPLVRTGRTLRQLPFVAEQVPEEVAAPLRRRGGPGDFQAAGNRVTTFAAAEGALPAEALLFHVGSLGHGSHILGRIGGAVALAEGVSSGDEGNGLFVIHGHAGEGLADIPRRGDGIRISIRSFGIHVDQAHLDGGERILQVTVAGVALVGQPLALGPPVNVLLRFPDVLPPAAETEGLETHGLQRHVAGQDHEVRPGEFAAVLLLDGPKQPAGLVEVHIVRPAVEGCEALAAMPSTAPTIGDAVRACAVPRHADEERPVVAEVRRPPVL